MTKSSSGPELVSSVGKLRESYEVSGLTLLRRGFLKVFGYVTRGMHINWEVMERGNAVFILPVDRTKRCIYLIHQHRIQMAFARNPEFLAAKVTMLREGKFDGTLTVSADEVLAIDASAGMVDKGETPLQAAVRELLEETGFIAPPEAFTLVSDHHPSVGGTTERHICYTVDVTGWSPTARPEGDGTENIETYAYTYEQAYRLWKGNHLQHATINVMLGKFFDQLRDELYSEPFF